MEPFVNYIDKRSRIWEVAMRLRRKRGSREWTEIFPMAEFMFSKTWRWVTQKTEGVPGSSRFPTGSAGVISAATSAGFPPANTANCVWRSTCCHRLKPHSPRKPASAFSPAKEDFWTHALQPFQCGVSSRLQVNWCHQTEGHGCAWNTAPAVLPSKLTV